MTRKARRCTRIWHNTTAIVWPPWPKRMPLAQSAAMQASINDSMNCHANCFVSKDKLRFVCAINTTSAMNCSGKSSANSTWGKHVCQPNTDGGTRQAVFRFRICRYT